jgi:hypothetical protein
MPLAAVPAQNPHEDSNRLLPACYAANRLVTQQEETKR